MKKITLLEMWGKKLWGKKPQRTKSAPGAERDRPAPSPPPSSDGLDWTYQHSSGGADREVDYHDGWEDRQDFRHKQRVLSSELYKAFEEQQRVGKEL